MDTKTTDRLLKSDEFRENLGGISTVTLWRWIQQGKVPQPIKLSKNGINFFKGIMAQ